jgi:hypothetical protein
MEADYSAERGNRLDSSALPEVSNSAQFFKSERMSVAGYRGLVDELLVRTRQAPISMRLGARQSGGKLALLSGLGATSRATNCQG